MWAKQEQEHNFWLRQKQEVIEQLNREWRFIYPEFWAGEGSWLEFQYSVLLPKGNRTTHPLPEWLKTKLDLLQSIVRECGWIFPYENVCIVCNRPIKLSLDHEQRLHAEGEPAIQFADGFSVWAERGVCLPEN